MFENLSIAKKIHIPLIASFLIGFAIFILISYNSIDQIEEDIYAKEMRSMQAFFHEQIHQQKVVCTTNAIAVAQSRAVYEWLIVGDRPLAVAALKRLETNYKKYPEASTVKLHVHTKDGFSFIRSWKPEKHGDDLKKFRQTVNDVRRYHAESAEKSESLNQVASSLLEQADKTKRDTASAIDMAKESLGELQQIDKRAGALGDNAKDALELSNTTSEVGVKLEQIAAEVANAIARLDGEVNKFKV